MKFPPFMPRYNQLIRKMRARMRRRWRLESRIFDWLISLLLAICFSPSILFASNLGDTARQLAGRIASATGPGSITIEIVNRSSLDEKAVREVRGALQAELHGQGVRIVNADQAVGTVNVVLSESLREFVWTAEIAIGNDPPRTILVSLPRSAAGVPFAAPLPIALKTIPLFSQEERVLDVALVDNATTPGSPPTASARLLALEDSRVAIYRQQSGRWELDASLPITVSRALPRDLRGRLLLRRDHLFDVFLPGTLCRSSGAMPLTLTCAASDDPWPLTSEEAGGSDVRAFYAGTRNFFTGVLSPGIGRIANAPTFYSAAGLTRQGYILWAVAAVDGSAHVIDGVTDQTIRGARWGSDLAAVRSGCGTGTQLLVSGDSDALRDHERDTVRAFEIPDRELVAVSAPVEFDGTITALWPNADGTSAVVVVKRDDTGQYEASRIIVACGN
jgi:hypothetical protein